MPGPSAPISFTSTKMNLGLAQTLDWIDALLLPNARRLAALSFFACLPYPVLHPARERLAASGVTVAAQDVWVEAGAVTGEVSPALLAEIGCTHTMVGHAERRALFGESDTLVARKAAAASHVGVTPVVCVGESQPTAAHEAAALATAQARAVTDAVPAGRSLLFLYEPGWTIGGSRAADPAHTGHVLRALREATRGHDVRFLYGGAVVPGTYTDLRREGDWDGVALGRAAQDPALLAETLDELLPRTGLVS
ncbi:triose-phosphate isomerase [Streptomyces sp. NPDC002644]